MPRIGYRADEPKVFFFSLSVKVGQFRCTCIYPGAEMETAEAKLVPAFSSTKKKGSGPSLHHGFFSKQELGHAVWSLTKKYASEKWTHA